MALENATAQQRMGQAVIRRQANARLVPDGAVSVDGLLVERPTSLAMNAEVALGNEITFHAVASELPEDLDNGALCSVFIGDQRQIERGRFTVRYREDLPLIDNARLELELAPA